MENIVIYRDISEYHDILKKLSIFFQ